MNRKILIAFLAFAISVQGWSQRGKDGAGVINAAGTVVNNFTILTADASSGATSITVADNAMNAFFPGNLAAGDLIFIYQTQGATLLGVPNGNVGSPNSFTWGEVTDYGNAGNYEFAEVISVSGTTGITLSCALQNDYSISGRVQVVRVPRYATLTVQGSGSITSPVWNSAAGGIIAIECDGDITVDGIIDANGGGFRGGSLVGDNISGFSGDWAVNVAFPDAGAEKGESIAGYQSDYDTNNGGRIGRAAPANGGGGGNAHNAGGAGGANAAAPGVTWSGFGRVDPAYNTSWNLEAGWLPNHNRAGGGKGGYSFSSSDQDATLVGPSNSAWGGDWRRPYGGQGGRTLDYSTGKLFFGGGGGAGDQNNDDGGEGGRGGGLIFIMGYGNLSGTGTIRANGLDGETTDNSNPPFGGFSGTDGAGGGGAGGVIVANVNGIVSGVNMSVLGGKGGDQNTAAGAFGTVSEAEGPGGGGGGGYIAVSAGGPTRTATGGANGTTDSPDLTEFPPNGATNGGNGNSTASIDNYYPTVTDQTICSGNSTTLTASITGTSPAGTTIGWFDQEVGGTLLGTGTTYNTGVLVATTTYYVGLCPGHYRIPVTVTIAPAIVIDETGLVIADETCAGNDGSITGITVSGGTPPFSYDWSGTGTAGPDYTNIAGGSYTLTVTDAAGCTATSGPHVVATGAGPTVDISNIVTVNTTCGNPVGSITGITHSGGVAPITYLWTPGAYTTLDITNIPAGNYTLDVIDNLGCTTTVGPFAITDTPGPTLDISNIVLTNETCSNSNGAIEGIVVNGGTTPYAYDWNSGAYTTLDITGIPATSYTLTVTDANGCTATTGPHVIIDEAGPTIDVTNIAIVGETCGNVDGAITGITVAGGTGALTYDWSGTGTAGPDYTNISAGGYTLTVTDANGCTATSGPHVVPSIGGPTVDVTGLVIVDETCTLSNGSVTGITVSGGQTPYAYDWNSGAFSTLDITGLAASNYTLTVTDGNGCTVTVGPFAVNDQASPTLDVSNMVITNETCTLGNGSITGIVVNGGTSPFSYNWNAGAFSTLDISSLSANNYSLTVTDANGCTVSTGPHVVIDESGPVIDDSNVAIVDEACSQVDGSITGITVTGGTAPLTYDWSGAATAGTDYTNIAAGTYTLTITDANGCTATSGPHTVNMLAAPVLDISNITITDETCTGTNGAISGITVSGGTGAITYDWNGGAFSTLDITGLSAGGFTLIVTDARGCTASAGPFAIVDMPAPIIDETNMVITNELCTAGDGSITGIVVNGGTAPLVYDWNSGAYSTLDISNLSAGNYTLTVTDANGCTATSGPHAITDSPGPTIDISGMTIVDENCGSGNGSITGITASGGAGPLIYVWGTTITPNADYTNLSAGSYTLNVADQNGCTASTGPHSVGSIGGPTVDVSNMVQVDETCSNSNGSITGITVSGGTPPYTTNWTGGGGFATLDITGLAQGIYTLTVTDAGGCSVVVGPLAIVDQTAPTVDDTNMVLTDETCTASNGSITGIVVSGGTAPITYDWNSGAFSTLDITSLPAGSYSLVITDANGCAVNAGPYVLTDTPGPTLDATAIVITDENCGQTDGSITGIAVSGGASPYTYDWSGTSTASPDHTNIASGAYTLTVTDANGCTATSGPHLVNSAGGPVVDASNIVITDESCTGFDGSITGITASGGAGSFTYEWNSTPSVGLDTLGLAAGSYILTVTDGNGCATIAGPFNVGTVVPDPFTITVNGDASLCEGDSILLTGTVAGGAGNVDITWTDASGTISTMTITGSATPTGFDVWYTPTASGQICLDAVDQCGTTPVSACFNLTVNPLPTVAFIADITAGCSPLTVTFICTNPGGTNEWFLGEGALVFGDTVTHEYTTPGTYDITKTVTSDSGCVATLTMPAMITVYEMPVADFFSTPNPGTADDPTIDFTDGSSGPITTWDWDFAGEGTSTSQNDAFTFSGPGTYNVTLTVTTADGCSDMTSETIVIDEILEEVIIPNVMSPNSDGNNDVFVIQNLPAGVHQLTIFNRWGQLMFEAKDYLNNWDGYTQSGVQVPEGTYYYVLILEGEEPLEGFITLVR